MKKASRPLLIALTLIFTLILTAGSAGAAPPAWPETAGPLTPATFQATTEEGAGFEAALDAAGQPDGFMITGRRPAVYCQADSQFLEIHWRQEVSGRNPADQAEGYGEMALKYADDSMVLERYRGEFKNGYRDGWGELLARDDYLDNAFFYRGDFRQGHMEGRGIYLNNDFQDRGGAPFIYEGEFLADAFHGWGVMTDLASGRIIHSGLWFDGFPFEEGEDKWEQANREAGLETQLAARPVMALSAGDIPR